MFVCTGTIFSQTYVNLNAAGANDGSSWANAYTNLNTALANTSSGEIWVAAATYLPGTDTTDIFSISSGVSLYGGFNGTETNLSQRDVSGNETILSGDLNGDDLVGNFAMNKSDNSEHVIYVDSLIATGVTIDGFTIQGGHTADDGDLATFLRSGGGIFALSPVSIKNCTFQHNFSRTGASVYIAGQGHGSEVLDCSFTRNATSSQSAGIFATTITDLKVKRCFFELNETQRGAFYPLYCSGVEVDSCYFGNNTNATGFGGAFFIWNSTDILLTNTIFYSNTAANAGAINYNGSELASPNANNFIIRDCSFSENVATDFGGGAIWNGSGSYTFENCSFQDNIADNGGHVFQNAPGNIILFKESQFVNGTANGWGGGLTCYGLDADYTFEACLFEDNTAANLGGAVNNGFSAKSTYINCDFEENTSQNSAGGALALQNDSTTVLVFDCIFSNNFASTGGGAIFSGSAQSSAIVEVDGSEFWVNSTSTGGGGAISASEFGDDDIGVLNISNSLFGYNLGSGQGGAVELLDVDSDITSCLFFGNVASEGAGAGGAISINATDSNQIVVNILNSTFADNEGDLAAGISNWTGANGAVSNTTIQNNIFRHEGTINYAVEGGTPVLTSLGGNLSDDGSLSGILTHPKDIEFEDPDFVEPDDFDYTLQDGSIAIDAGVNAGAPALDILGNPRINDVDLGALENQNTVNVKEAILDNNGQLSISPNPVVTNTMNAMLKNQWNGEISVRIFNASGKLMNESHVSKISQDMPIELDISNFNRGVFDLVASNGEQAIVARFVKI